MSHKKRNRKAQRDVTTPITTDPLEAVLRPTTVDTKPDLTTKIAKTVDQVSHLVESFEDLRRFDPQHQVRRRITTAGKIAYKKMVPAKRRAQLRELRTRAEYVNPNNVYVCIRRKLRREVLFALDHMRKGGRGGGKRRRTEQSNIKC